MSDQPTPETCPIRYDHEGFGSCAVCGGEFGMLGEPLPPRPPKVSEQEAEDRALIAADPKTLTYRDRSRRAFLMATGDYDYPTTRAVFDCRESYPAEPS